MFWSEAKTRGVTKLAVSFIVKIPSVRTFFAHIVLKPTNVQSHTPSIKLVPNIYYSFIACLKLAYPHSLDYF